MFRVGRVSALLLLMWTAAGSNLYQDTETRIKVFRGFPQYFHANI